MTPPAPSTNRLSNRCHGLGWFARHEKRHAEIVLPQGKFRPKPRRVLQFLHRLVDRLPIQQRQTEVVVGARRIGIEPDRPPQLIHTRSGLPKLQHHNTQQGMRLRQFRPARNQLRERLSCSLIIT